MKVLSMFRIDAAGNPVGMMLVNERFTSYRFCPCYPFYLSIIAIAVVTAFFPARRAANLSAAEALRHFD
jgi:ABC-type lipoprotein release transport system permease subunit